MFYYTGMPSNLSNSFQLNLQNFPPQISLLLCAHNLQEGKKNTFATLVAKVNFFTAIVQCLYEYNTILIYYIARFVFSFT
jgi:hypothetical protein